jgi:hypothetical protein
LRAILAVKFFIAGNVDAAQSAFGAEADDPVTALGQPRRGAGLGRGVRAAAGGLGDDRGKKIVQRGITAFCRGQTNLLEMGCQGDGRRAACRAAAVLLQAGFDQRLEMLAHRWGQVAAGNEDLGQRFVLCVDPVVQGV